MVGIPPQRITTSAARASNGYRNDDVDGRRTPSVQIPRSNWHDRPDQDPGFLDHVINKKADIVRVYLPPSSPIVRNVPGLDRQDVDGLEQAAK